MITRPRDSDVQCPECAGQGVYKKWPGDRSPDRDCKYCDGSGGVSEDKCEAWHEHRRDP